MRQRRFGWRLGGPIRGLHRTLPDDPFDDLGPDDRPDDQSSQGHDERQDHTVLRQRCVRPIPPQMDNGRDGPGSRIRPLPQGRFGFIPFGIDDTGCGENDHEQPQPEAEAHSMARRRFPQL